MPRNRIVKAPKIMVRKSDKDYPMFETGDTVCVVDNGEIRLIVGIGPGEFFSTQLGNDAGTVKPIRGRDLELVAKAKKADAEPGFVPKRLITDVGY